MEKVVLTSFIYFLSLRPEVLWGGYFLSYISSLSEGRLAEEGHGIPKRMTNTRGNKVYVSLKYSLVKVQKDIPERLAFCSSSQNLKGSKVVLNLYLPSYGYINY
jgi:hypothetical protein